MLRRVGQFVLKMRLSLDENFGHERRREKRTKEKEKETRKEEKKR